MAQFALVLHVSRVPQQQQTETRAGTAQRLEHHTHDWKVAGSSLCNDSKGQYLCGNQQL